LPDIHIHRAHTLGLARARKTAWSWAEDAEKRFGMECTVVEGDDEDVVEFERSGVKGRLLVTKDAFDLQARLGLLVGAFKERIAGEIEANFDRLLAKAPAARSKKA
jgi:putative polyhydroxyalkanoate system protein